MVVQACEAFMMVHQTGMLSRLHKVKPVTYAHNMHDKLSLARHDILGAIETAQSQACDITCISSSLQVVLTGLVLSAPQRLGHVSPFLAVPGLQFEYWCCTHA